MLPFYVVKITHVRVLTGNNLARCLRRHCRPQVTEHLEPCPLALTLAARHLRPRDAQHRGESREPVLCEARRGALGHGEVLRGGSAVARHAVAGDLMHELAESGLVFAPAQLHGLISAYVQEREHEGGSTGGRDGVQEGGREGVQEEGREGAAHQLERNAAPSPLWRMTRLK